MKKGLKGLVLLFTAVMGCFLMAACNSELPQLEAINGNDGQDGKDGKDGLSIIWKGALDEAPAEPELNWAYYNKNDGCSYIYNGSEWNLLAKAGKKGDKGEAGKDANLEFLNIETSFIDDPLVPHNTVPVSIRTGSAPIEKIGYVYGLVSISSEIFSSDSFTDITASKDSNGLYHFTAEEKGNYLIAAKDMNGFMAYTVSTMENIDRVAEPVENLNGVYDYETSKFIVTWDNPEESNFDHVLLSYTKNGEFVVENIEIRNAQSYSVTEEYVKTNKYIFTVCSVDSLGNISKPGNIGYGISFKIDTDPTSFAPGNQIKFQFKISGFDIPAGANIQFYFCPEIENFDGSVRFRSINTNEIWIDGATRGLPTEIGEEVAFETGTVTKINSKWYKVDANVVAADNAIGFSFYKIEGLPQENDCLYFKDFVISYMDEEGATIERYYNYGDFVYDEVYTPNPLKLESWYSVEGLRVTERFY